MFAILPPENRSIVSNNEVPFLLSTLSKTLNGAWDKFLSPYHKGMIPREDVINRAKQDGYKVAKVSIQVTEEL